MLVNRCQFCVCRHCVPVTCVRLSILDFGHSLRVGSNMGQGCTAKAALCFAIIHLHKRNKSKNEKTNISVSCAASLKFSLCRIFQVFILMQLRISGRQNLTRLNQVLWTGSSGRTRLIVVRLPGFYFYTVQNAHSC